MEMEEVKYEKIICPMCETEQLACRRNCIHCGITLTKTVDTVDKLKELLTYQYLNARNYNDKRC